MSEQKSEPKVEVKQPDGVKPPEVKPEDKPVAIAAPVAKALESTTDLQFSAHERVPSDWEVLPLDDERIHATNIKSAKVFIGTTKEFSAALRGL